MSIRLRGKTVSFIAILSLHFIPMASAQDIGEPATQSSASNSKSALRRLFVGYCKQCHGVLHRAPSPEVLRRMTADRIYEALTTGPMRNQGAMLSEHQKRAMAEWVSGEPLGMPEDGDAAHMPNRCHRDADVSESSPADWSGWGYDLHNSRFQSESTAGVSLGTLPKLKLRWTFGFPGASSVYGQPAVMNGTVYAAADSGYVYALDAKTGCVYWSFRADAGVRSGPTVGSAPGSRHGYSVYFGDLSGGVYSIDASTGRLNWKVSADSHPLARIHGAIKLYQQRLYVPVTSFEEAQTITDSAYHCCTFRGSLVALDAATGKEIWRTYTIADTPRIQTRDSGGEFIGPAGAGVWNSPAIDVSNDVLYFGTGNSYSGPAASQADAVLATRLQSGAILWSKQLLPGDIWPLSSGLDQDIVASVIICTRPGRARVAIVGQKAMGVWAIDLNRRGAVLWHQTELDPTVGGGDPRMVLFGGAADSDSVYFGLSPGKTESRGGGLVALDLETGKRRWYRAVPAQRSMRDHPGISAAVSLIPGAVFTGGLDGMIRVFSSTDGEQLWSFDTSRKFRTVNGVAGHGGSIGSAGPVIAEGAVFVTSGYVGFLNGIPGNLLLAFSPGGS